jgi:4-hydroxybenzoate polyprenyltransferase
VVLTWLLGFGIAAVALPAAYSALVAVYLIGTAAYSIWLKKEPVLDVIFLAGLYVLRVVGGGLAIDVPVSTWLLAFTLFSCLSLAFLKRFIEVRAKSADPAAAVAGRGYETADAVWLQSAGLASAYLSVVVLALYVNNPDVMRLYAKPDRLLLMCPIILYGATRVWLNAQRGKMHDDPLVAVAMDPVTYVLAAITATVVILAI